MKPVQVSYQLGHASQTLFATSVGISVLVHGLVIGWLLSSSGSTRSLLSDAPSFQMVSLVDVPGPALLPESEPAVIPEVLNAKPVKNVAPETVVPPPQAKQATEVPEAAVEPPAPVVKPVAVEEPERPSVVETQVKKPAPTKASARKPAPAAPTVAAVEAKATPAPAPKAAVKPKPASRNSPRAETRAKQTIAALRRAQAHVQGASTDQAQGGITARMQDIQLNAYQGRVRTRIINAWRLPMMRQTAQALQAVALLTIDREGQVIRYQLIRSSGSQPFDASLQRAVQASSPLPPLPETFPGEILEAEIRFTPPVSS